MRARSCASASACGADGAAGLPGVGGSRGAGALGGGGLSPADIDEPSSAGGSAFAAPMAGAPATTAGAPGTTAAPTGALGCSGCGCIGRGGLPHPLLLATPASGAAASRRSPGAPALCGVEAGATAAEPASRTAASALPGSSAGGCATPPSGGGGGAALLGGGGGGERGGPQPVAIPCRIFRELLRDLMIRTGPGLPLFGFAAVGLGLRPRRLAAGLPRTAVGLALAARVAFGGSAPRLARFAAGLALWRRALTLVSGGPVPLLLRFAAGSAVAAALWLGALATTPPPSSGGAGAACAAAGLPHLAAKLSRFTAPAAVISCFTAIFGGPAMSFARSCETPGLVLGGPAGAPVGCAGGLAHLAGGLALGALAVSCSGGLVARLAAVRPSLRGLSRFTTMRGRLAVGLAFPRLAAGLLRLAAGLARLAAELARFTAGLARFAAGPARLAA